MMSSYSQILNAQGAPRIDQVMRDDGIAVLTGFLPLGGAGEDPFSVEGFADTDGLAYRAWLAAGNVLAPPAPPSRVALLAEAERLQATALSTVFSFDVGTSDAPLRVTTRLDDAGGAAMTKLALWAILNASNASAREPYSNVDFSAAILTPTQALSLAQQSGALVSASYATLNAAAAGISAKPPTITTFAALAALSWPSG